MWSGQISISSSWHQSWSYASRNEHTVHHESNLDVAFRSFAERAGGPRKFRQLLRWLERCAVVDAVVYHFGRSMTYSREAVNVDVMWYFHGQTSHCGRHCIRPGPRYTACAICNFHTPRSDNQIIPSVDLARASEITERVPTSRYARQGRGHEYVIASEFHSGRVRPHRSGRVGLGHSFKIRSNGFYAPFNANNVIMLIVGLSSSLGLAFFNGSIWFVWKLQRYNYQLPTWL